MSYLTVNNKPLPLQPHYSCFRMLLAGAYWTPQTPRYVWGWWMKSVLVSGWILQFFQYFPIFLAFLWVKYVILWLYAVQIWGWRNNSICPWLLVTCLFCWLGHFGEIMRNSVCVVLTINTQILQLDKLGYALVNFDAKLFDGLPWLSRNWAPIIVLFYTFPSDYRLVRKLFVLRICPTFSHINIREILENPH